MNGHGVNRHATRGQRLGRTALAAVLGAVLVGAATAPAANAAHTPPQPRTSKLRQLANPTTDPVGGPRLNERGIIEDSAAGPLPAFDGTSFVIADATTGDILAAMDPHGPARPASTQKTLLALTMLPRLDPNGTYTADREDVSVEGTRVGMAAGQTYTINDMWYALLLRSANDAAMGLAKAGAGGDLARAVRMEMAEAHRLQALDTTVVNPSGLDADGQFSSAYDLALWGRAMLQRGDARKYMATQHWLFPGNITATKQPADPAVLQVNTINHLLGKYPGIVGVKPGYTTLAHNTDIVAAERDGRTILVTLMGVPGHEITDMAAAYLDWGFAHDGTAVPVGKLVDPISPSVLSPDDDGYATASVHEAAAVKPSTARIAPISLHWSAVSGGALAALMLAVGAARLVGRRRRRALIG